MHRRLLMMSSALMCVLAVFLAWVLSDLHDRSLPQAFHPSAVISITLPDGMRDVDAFGQLREQNAKLDLGLVKIVPDMERGTDAQVFIPLPGTVLRGLPSDSLIRRFGSLPNGMIADVSRLDSASAGGQYLVCDRWDEFTRESLNAWATRIGVRLDYDTDDVTSDIRMLLGNVSFRVAVGATIALVAVLVLFWLSFKARSRALRVLAGVPAWKIQYDDTLALIRPMLLVALIVDVIAVLVVCTTRGWVFVPYLLRVTVLCESVLLGCLLMFTFVVSAVCWPSVQMIAMRSPIPQGLSRVSMLVKAVVFVALLAVITPSVTSLNSASASAREQSVWQRLRNQVSVSFDANNNDLTTNMAAMIHTMAQRNTIALSYAFTDDPLEHGTIDAPVTGIVTRSWLDLIGVNPDTTAGITPISDTQLPEQAQQIVSQFTTWANDDTQAARLRSQSHYYAVDGVTVPLLKGGSDEMLFPRHATIIVVPDVKSFSDSGFLIPALSSRNIVMSGLDDTRQQVVRTGLSNAVSVRYIAEEQILRAQFSAYFAWMQAATIVLLLAAFVIITVVGADVRATLRAKHDYPLLLSGYAPIRLAALTMLTETLLALVATGILCGLLIAQHTDSMIIAMLIIVAILAIGFSAICHQAAVHARFRAINYRTL